MFLEDKLIVGLDDSNHAAKRSGEIIVAAFSFDLEDEEVKKFGKRANYNEALEWLNESKRDYRFTILRAKKFRYLHTNLPHTAEQLIQNYIETNNLKLKKISIFFDGEIQNYQVKNLKNLFNNYEIEIKNFIKTRGIHVCPKVIYMADILANTIYNDHKGLLKNKKFIPYNLNNY
jgi:hypothetical protein